MKIEVWSDYVCPFCYIGKRKFEAALEQFAHADQVEVSYNAFELDPNSKAYDGQDYYEELAKKFGSIEQVKQMTANVKEQAAQVGLNYDFDKMKPTNTFTAHRLTKFAEKEGKGNEMTEALLHAHFIDGKDIGSLDDLADIAQAVGLDSEQAKTVITDESQFKADVEADLQAARDFQITGVPFFIFNRKYAVSGAQPQEAFLQALEQVWEEENKQSPFETIGSESDTVCTDDGCYVPENKDE